MVSYCSSTIKLPKPNGIHKRSKLKPQHTFLPVSSRQSASLIESSRLEEEESGMIGMLTKKERLFRVQRFLEKKRHFHEVKKQQIQYKCRKTVADKRLRIKGRFVTKEQAFEILGLTQQDLLDNEAI